VRAFITGVNGHLGSALVPILQEKGWKISGLVRKTSNRAAIKDFKIDLLYGDIADLASFKEAAQGCEAIFHLAAPTTVRTEKDRDSVKKGILNICALAQQQSSFKRIVYVSSSVTVGVVDSSQKELDEETFMDLSGTPYQRLKNEAEQMISRLARDYGLDIVIVNPSTIVGSGDFRPTPPNQLIVNFLNCAGSWRWLRGPELKAAPVWFDTGFSIVGVSDAARGLYRAYEKGRSRERYILGGDNITLYQFYKTLSKLTGLPAPGLYLPRSAMFVASWLLTKLLEHPPLSYSLAKTMVGKYAFFSSRKAQQELGYEWQPHESVLKNAVSWFLQTELIREERKAIIRDYGLG